MVRCGGLQIITAEPDVRRVAITPEDRFFLLACDGVWDVMSNQEVRPLHRRNPFMLKRMRSLALPDAYTNGNKRCPRHALRPTCTSYPLRYKRQYQNLRSAAIPSS